MREGGETQGHTRGKKPGRHQSARLREAAVVIYTEIKR